MLTPLTDQNVGLTKIFIETVHLEEKKQAKTRTQFSRTLFRCIVPPSVKSIFLQFIVVLHSLDPQLVFCMFFFKIYLTAPPGRGSCSAETGPVNRGMSKINFGRYSLVLLATWQKGRIHKCFSYVCPTRYNVCPTRYNVCYIQIQRLLRSKLAPAALLAVVKVLPQSKHWSCDMIL